MNKYQLYTLGGAMLAATSLAGAAQAAVGNYNTATRFQTGALKLSNTAISPTATTANAQVIGGGTSAENLGILFGNAYSNTFDLYITIPITGASAVTTPNPTASYLIHQAGDAGGSVTTTVSAANLNVGLAPTVSALGNQIFISNVAISFVGGTQNGVTTASASIVGVILDGLSFTNVSGLATVGSTITLGATVASQANQAQIYETVAPGAVITSVAPLTTTVTAGTAASVAVGTGTTQFTSFATTGNSVVLATISITGTGALATDLSTVVTADGAVSTANTVAATTGVNFAVTTTALSDPAIASVSLVSGLTTITDATVANFSAGSATFAISAGSTTYTGTTTISLAYSGSTAISAAAAGTVSLTYSIGGTASSLVAPAGASGATAVISRGGLSTQVNWANSGSGSGFTSYLRIHNSGSVPATATVVLKQDTADGSPISTVGTYTTPTSIPAGGSVQISVPTIESALSITPNAAHSYTLLISGAFPGYVQHLSLAANGSLVDLDGFRSAGQTTP